MHDKAANSPHHVAIVVFDGVELFELAVGIDVFGTAVTGPDGRPLYRLSVCGPAPSVMTAAGFAMQVPSGLDVARAADTIVVTPAAVSDLAARAAMSPRTFARRFLASTGTTPLRWILAERVRLAQRLLETTELPVGAVAHNSGFGTPDNLRKHFARAVRTTPQAYRRAFRQPGAATAGLDQSPGRPQARRAS